jgi:hypothetical protein
MPPRKKAISPIAACRTLEMLIEKYGCKAETVGRGYEDYTPLKTPFIAVINMSGKILDFLAFIQYMAREEHGKIDGFPVKLFFPKTIH